MIATSDPRFSLALQGTPSLSEPLASALEKQWAYGFPIVPKPGLQLTHGFLQYPAGMQALAAQSMLEVLPSGLLLDPFVGGGTTLIEALCSGRQVVGADVSPLALFATSHHTWRGTDQELNQLRADATEALQRAAPAMDAAEAAPASDAPSGDQSSPPKLDQRGSRGLARGGAKRTTWKMWRPLQDEVERLCAKQQGGASAVASSRDQDNSSDGGPQMVIAAGRGCTADVFSPLWFCYAAAQQRSERYKLSSIAASFEATVDSYCEAVRALRTASPNVLSPSPAFDLVAAAATGAVDARMGSAPPPPPFGINVASVVLCDARELSLERLGLPLADAVLTSPPYAGVYDYLSHARESRASLGASGAAPLMGMSGTPSGRDWPLEWRSSHEMGARKAMKKLRAPGAFGELWHEDQLRWLGATRANLRSGGRAALLVGDGEANIDGLESTTRAAEEVGFRVLASATITSSAAYKNDRQKGRRRPEHAILLEAP